MVDYDHLKVMFKLIFEHHEKSVVINNRAGRNLNTVIFIKMIDQRMILHFKICSIEYGYVI